MIKWTDQERQPATCPIRAELGAGCSPRAWPLLADCENCPRVTARTRTTARTSGNAPAQVPGSNHQLGERRLIENRRESTMPRYTPGPWKHSELPPGCPGDSYVFAHGEVLAVVRDDGGDDARQGRGPANARLMATAPRLLDALRVIALDVHTRRYLYGNDPKALEQIDAAIAAAADPE